MHRTHWEAEDIEEFKRIFLHCVETHYHTEGILYHDISENTLMIWRPANGIDLDARESNNAQKSFGVLNDFDMAVEVNAKGRSPPIGAGHRTATLPFMAVDLLGNNMGSGPHLYRHDLESFFYILVWAAVHYDLKHKRRTETPEKFQKWLTHENAYAEKKAFLFSSIDADSKIYGCVASEFKDVWDEWVIPLQKLFRRAFYYELERKESEEGYDYETIDGKITFEGFMTAIGVKPRGLE
ncbi:hypothetical protein CPB84DRAFT_1852740 [Gymnopilus junonius]|uniref:Fungal-type protein kinase domain-containing protein n=1 Tax=Gymnopilus junonius TaxID=109634 RepID=A0A9P5N9X2_GYMJU|nr:hypothetical protein CPB84DRAFT_1852740 [Gymnopilus junonius]